MNWRGNNNVSSFSENVLIVYFEELSTILKPSTMWSHYSMIKATLNIKHNVDINKYLKLTALMKRKSDGYIAKKSKILGNDEIKRFLDQAPDEVHLLTKVSSYHYIVVC